MKNIVWVGLFGVVLTGCSLTRSVDTSSVNMTDTIQQGNVDQGPEVRTIKIGVIAPLSGPGASYGQDVVAVVERFGDVFNTSYSDVQLERIVENGGCSGKDAASAAQKLTTVDKVQVIIGGVCSSETLAAGKIAQEAEILMIAPGSASSLVSTLGERVVRTNNNTVAAATLQDFVAKRYATSIIVAEQKDYPQDIADRFAEVTDTSVTRLDFSPDERDFTALAKQIGNIGDSDALFLFTQSEATSIPLVKALASEGLLDQYNDHIYGANTLLIPAFLETFGAEVDGFKEVNVVLPLDPLVLDNAYYASIEEYVPLGDGFTLMQAADAMRMIIMAVESGATESLHFKQFVYLFSTEEPYIGYVGKYWFDDKGDAVGVDFTMYEATDGVSTMIQ